MEKLRESFGNPIILRKLEEFGKRVFIETKTHIPEELKQNAELCISSIVKEKNLYRVQHK
jgi:organic radical activating enzyme